MFKLTKAQANAIQELNWVYVEECSPEDQALHAAIGTRKLTDEQCGLLDMDFVVDRAEQELEDNECMGEPRDRIGYVSRLRSMRLVQRKLASHMVLVQQRCTVMATCYPNYEVE